MTPVPPAPPDAAARLAACVLALALGAGIVVARGASRGARERGASRAFQTTVLGLGLGPSLDVSRCPPAFDPRVGALCPERTGPITGGDAFSAVHARAVLGP